MTVESDRLVSALHAWTPDLPAGHAAPAALGVLEAAEAVLAAGREHDLPDGTWREYLETTARPPFLAALGPRPVRERWADTTFRALLVPGYDLETLFDARVRAHPDRILFHEPRPQGVWTYAQVARLLRAIAGAFLTARPDGARVAIFCENSAESASCDLACLVYQLLVTPLNVHFDAGTLAWIFERLDINVVVTDTSERLARLAEVRARSGRDFTVFRVGEEVPGDGPLRALPLRQTCAQLDLAAVGHLLAAHPKAPPEAPATVMFTSGSTGQPKGVVFSHYNLISKRFARAAALPAVGRNEVLLCYLPLFHTFGRYLEMMGMLFWGGTYVFAGNPSAEALIAQLREVRPTGLIGVPVRWSQVREHCLEALDRAGDPARDQAIVRGIIGDRLRWGLSAAGYLDPKVFRFFQRHGVDLCSGFGMTEVTGGITMTPPGEYEDGTVGLPLPGAHVRLGDKNELQVGGPYVARYLEDEGPPRPLPPIDPREDFWLATGDLFRVHPSGYLEIVDRIKDIYKNSRGQTVAPRRVEQLFDGVPGLRHAFLAGDHRDYNVLLVAPDTGDPVLANRSDDEVQDYFRQIVTTANADLAPYERVINFALLDRDFDEVHEELTAKGSYRRKVIEEHFEPVIARLYRSNHVELVLDDLRVRIPRWVFRDLAVLEDEVVVREGGLHNRRTGATLRLARTSATTVQVGDLEYQVEHGDLDLGLFARQPMLWIGNPSLQAFAPCKSGWDVALGPVSPRVRLPRGGAGAASVDPAKLHVEDERLLRVNGLCIAALFGAPAEALRAVDALALELEQADDRVGAALRRRLEALAYRPEEEVRCRAYRTLLLDEPTLDYGKAFPTFVESGLTFLNEKSIEAIARSRLGERRLHALRLRLFSYRTQLAWPGNAARRRQFRTVFRLLAHFARHHREYYAPVRAELAAWALHQADPVLAAAAEEQLLSLGRWYESRMAATVRRRRPGYPVDKVVFEDGVPPAQAARLDEMLSDPTFLEQSILLAHGEAGFRWKNVAREGVWVSRIISQHHLDLYRLGINFEDGRHFGLLVGLGDDLRSRSVADTVFWLVSLSGHSTELPVLPGFGAWRRELGALSVAYVNDPTVWEKVRTLANPVANGDCVPGAREWRKLFVRGMAAFFTAWRQSGSRIVPGAVTPSNISVPDADFHEGTHILSLTGWRPYEGPLSLVRPLYKNFFRQTMAHHPQGREHLDPTWIYDACLEALGRTAGASFLDELDRALADEPASEARDTLARALAVHREDRARRPYVPLPVMCAVDSFQDWERANPEARPEAREDALAQVHHLYRLERFPDPFRYYLYRHTYFGRADTAVRAAFDHLLRRLLGDVRVLPSHLEELTELQATLADPADRAVFSRMVFPHAGRQHKLELLAVGEAAGKHVIVRSEVRDRSDVRYVVRDPLAPAELGQLYRLILETDYPKKITEQDRHLIVTDEQERIVGGLCFRWQDDDVVYVDAIVVAGTLKERGIGGALLEDFCVRMEAQGARVAKTNFFLRRFYAKHGFRVSQRWGGLVRFLGTEPTDAPTPKPRATVPAA